MYIFLLASQYFLIVQTRTGEVVFYIQEMNIWMVTRSLQQNKVSHIAACLVSFCVEDFWQGICKQKLRSAYKNRPISCFFKKDEVFEKKILTIGVRRWYINRASKRTASRFGKKWLDKEGAKMIEYNLPPKTPKGAKAVGRETGRNGKRDRRTSESLGKGNGAECTLQIKQC